VFDAVLPPPLLARLRDEIVAVLVIPGVHRDGDEREGDRRALPEHVENLQQRPAVFAARQPDHDPIAVVDQLVFDDGFRDLFG